MAALALAGTAAYFSVYGLTKLFAAAGIGITILAASLEFAKLVTVSYVYRFWKTIKQGLRGFYVFAVVFIMLLTSIGIYGFLTGAYQKSANKIQLRDAQIVIAENKKKLFTDQLDRINSQIKSAGERINTLSGLRAQQENRLDNLYNQKYIGSAQSTEKRINSSDDQIKLLNADITEKMRSTNTITDSIAYYDQKIAEFKSSDVSNEIGPYKFVADLTGIPVDKIVNYVAILIILVFDPLAIALLIGVNQLTLANSPLYAEEEEKDNFISRFIKNKMYKKEKEEEEEVIEEEILDSENDNKEEQVENQNSDEEGLKKKDNIEEQKIIVYNTEPALIFKSVEEQKSIDGKNIISLPEVKQTEIIFDFFEEITTTTTTYQNFVNDPVITIITTDSNINNELIEESTMVEEKIISIEKQTTTTDEPTKTTTTTEEPTTTTTTTENQITTTTTTDFFFNVTDDQILETSTTTIDDESVKSFLDAFEIKKDEQFQVKRMGQLKNRVNVAHFVPKN